MSTPKPDTGHAPPPASAPASPRPPRWSWRNIRDQLVPDPAPPGARELPPLCSSHAYLVVVGLLLAVFGPPMYAGAVSFVLMVEGAPVPKEDAATLNVAAMSGVAAMVWLLVLTRPTRKRRTGRNPIAWWVAAWLLLAVCAVLIPYPSPLPEAAGATVFTVAGCWLTVALAARAGITWRHLGVAPRWASRKDLADQAAMMTRLSVAAVTASGYLLAAVALLPVPKMTESQPDSMGLPPVQYLARVVTAPILEEIVIVAFVVAVLLAARRPLWEAAAISIGVRLVIHGYYGVPAIGMVLWAAAHVWLFYRCRRITPLIAGHLLINLGGAAAQMRSPAVAVVLLAAIAALVGYACWRRRDDAEPATTTV